MILKDTWGEISRQVTLTMLWTKITSAKAFWENHERGSDTLVNIANYQVKSIGMEAFEKVWSINSDMSVYLRPDCELEPGDVERWVRFWVEKSGGKSSEKSSKKYSNKYSKKCSKINSDMCVYLRPDCELEPGDVERSSNKWLNQQISLWRTFQMCLYDAYNQLNAQWSNGCWFL